jgi:nucleotide-binding universal stress UspA family protein
MKAILIPTDFSEVSHNAIDYAIGVADYAGATLFLLHVYQVPVVMSELAVAVPSLKEIEKDSMDVLHKIKQSISLVYGQKVKVHCACSCGDTVEQINLFAEENNIDLVVMGMRGAGYISEKLIGSTTTALIKASNLPVLVINEKMKFKNVNKIILASDYDKVSGQSILNPLLDFVKLFKAHVYVLNVIKESEKMPTQTNAQAGVTLDHDLQGVDHSFNFIENNDTIVGINNFAENIKADMVAVVSRKHSFFENMVHVSNTKRMAFHTSVPLLALHG